MSSGKCKLKQYYYIPIRVVKIQNTDNTKCWQACGATGTLLLLVGIQNATATLEDCLMISYKIKHTITIWSNNHAPWYLPKWVENLCPHKNLHRDVYSRFIHNCQNLEVTKMFLSRWMDKQTVVHPDNGMLFSDKKKWTIKSWKTWGNLKCIFLSERNQSEKLHTVWV